MEKKDDGSLTGSQVTRLNTRTQPPYIQMVQKALMEHGGEEGLTAEEINEYLIAANYDLSPFRARLLPYYLSQLTQRNKIIQDPSSGRYTIPGRAEVERLTSQVEEVLCKLKKAEDQYIKNLAGALAKEFRLSMIKKLKALLTEAIPSSGHGAFKISTSTDGSQPKIARSLIATASEMSPDPGHGGPGPTAEQSGDLGFHPRRASPGCLSPMGKRPNRPDDGLGGEARGSSSWSFKIPKNEPGLRPQQGRGGSDNPVDIGGPAVSPAARSAPERWANNSGIWIKRKSQRGKTTIWIKLPKDE